MSLIQGLTHREADCLKALARLTQAGWPAKLVDVAAELKIKPPSALELLERLRKRKLAVRGPTGYMLSYEGALVISRFNRIHRIFEVMFERAGIPIEKACLFSESLGVNLADEALDAICKTLNHPKRCPHGNPIPGEDEHAQ